MGTQACLATGLAYGECTNCPAPVQAGTAAPVAGTGVTAGTPAAGVMAGDVATAGVGAGMGAGSAAAGVEGGQVVDAGSADATVEDAHSGGPLPMGTVEGVSCGVGLPALCDLETEKCCVRSLQTDTCIAATDSCGCDLPNCTVMEAQCDGPEDCPEGQVCCGTLGGFGGGAGYERFECATSCDYAGTQRIACHQDMEDCPGNNVCSNSQLLTNLQVCIDPATIEQ